MRRLMLYAFVAVTSASFIYAGPPTGGTTPRGNDTDNTIKRGDVSMNVAMQLRVPNVELANVPLDDVFEFMRDVAGLNLYVNWPALEAAGIDRSAPVALKLRNIKMGKVMDLALSQASAGGPDLTWYISDNIVYVTTKELADRDMVTMIYPIQDLLVNVPDFDAPQFTPSSGGPGGGGGNIIGSSNDTQNNQNETMEERGQKIVDLVMQLVEPNVWVENGGFARIRYFNGTLIVTAPRSVQKQIGK